MQVFPETVIVYRADDNTAQGILVNQATVFIKFTIGTILLRKISSLRDYLDDYDSFRFSNYTDHLRLILSNLIILRNNILMLLSVGKNYLFLQQILFFILIISRTAENTKVNDDLGGNSLTATEKITNSCLQLWNCY